VEDLTEQATVDYDYELEEGWLEEHLLFSSDAKIPARESPVETHISLSISRFLCYFLYCGFLFTAFTSLFCFAVGPSAPAGPPEAADVLASTPVSPVSDDETPDYTFSSFISLLLEQVV
jgi:hypothetical protein